MKKKVQLDVNRINELEKKISELEKQAENLDEKLSYVEGAWSVLIVKFGNKIRKLVDDQVGANIDEVEYRMLKKLVDGNMFELKMKNKGKDGSTD